jgi:hypothetical protein
MDPKAIVRADHTYVRPRAVCPYCGLERTVNADGRFRYHTKKDSRTPCLGVTEKPE